MKIIAHRSGPTVYPEQTIASARLALQNGAAMVEVDTRFTKDDVIVISHDADPERVFGVSGDVGEMTAQEFLSLRHKEDPSYASHALLDYINCGVAPLLLHVKVGGERLTELLTLLKEHDYLHKVVLGVGLPEETALIKAWDPAVKVLAFMPKPELAEAHMAAGADYIRLWEQWVTEERVQQVLQGGHKVWIMACDPVVGYTGPGSLKKWEAMGVDAVLLNDVTKLD